MLNRIILIITGALILFVLLLSVFYYMKLDRQRHDSRVLRGRRTRNENEFYIRFSKLFQSSFLTRRYFLRLANQLRTVYPADDAVLNMEATRIMFRSIIIVMALLLFVLFGAGGDLVYIVLGIVVALLLFQILNTSGIRKIETRLLVQFNAFIDGVRENYNRLGRIDDAIAALIDSLPYEMSLHADRFYKIVTSSTILADAHGYTDVSPNQYFTTFVETSATTMEYGDKRLSNGESQYLRNLNYIKENVNNELLRRQKNDAKFFGLAAISILPVFFIKPIAAFWIMNIPDVAEFYNGAFGTISMALVFLVSVVCYVLILYLQHGGSTMEIRESGISKRLSNVRSVRLLVTGVIEKNYSKAMRTAEMLRFTGDHLGINAFYVRRFVTAGIAVLSVALVLSMSIVRERKEIRTNYQNTFESSIVPNDEYKDKMTDAVKCYISGRESIPKGTEEKSTRDALIESIENHTEITEDRFAGLVADEVLAKEGRLKNTYFKWYYMFIVAFAALFGYMAPYWILLFKQSSVKMDMEDEVAQFQTIVLMLMHVNGADLEMILNWMERFAFCFRTSIQECIYELPHKGQKALIDLRDSETFPPFQSFVSDLINIDNVGVERAFNGIEIDREYYKEKRKEDNQRSIEKKGTLAGFISLAPLLFTIIFYFIMPIARYALTTISSIQF